MQGELWPLLQIRYQRCVRVLHARDRTAGSSLLHLHQWNPFESSDNRSFIDGRGQRDEPVLDTESIDESLLPVAEDLLR